MDEKLYLVGETIDSDKFRTIARCDSIKEAISFMVSYFTEYDKEPNLSLTLLRVNKNDIIEHQAFH